MSSVRVVHYFDYKSPYAWLAQEETFRLAREFPGSVEWRPYTLDIPSYLGRAEVDERGRVLSEDRNPHQWRRVRYAYMDCRREATRRGLVLRGPRKIFDSSVAHIGFLYAKRSGDFRAYHDSVFERFWRRELDIEDPAVIRAVLAGSGIDPDGFDSFREGEGRRELEETRLEAEAAGVFGVPGYLVDGELYWGNERLPRVREQLGAGRAATPAPREPVPGRCLCRGIRFTIAMPTGFCTHCHCTMCRRNHGAGYVTWVGIPKENLRIESGADLLVRHRSSEHGTRSFCRTCGTSLLCESTTRPGTMEVPLGCLDGPIDRQPELHVWFDHRAPWVTISDALPRFGGETGFEPL